MNIHEKRSINSYNKKADNYDSTFDGKFTYHFKEMLQQIIVVPNEGKVLDIACGNGRLLQMLSQNHRFLGYGTDISEKMVENARQMNPSMIFQKATCDSLPFETNFFDVVTVCAAFHHFPDINSFAKEVYRILKPNGMLYVAEVYYPALIRMIFNPLVKLSRDGDVKFYAPDEITGLFRNTGFTNELFKKEGHIQIIAVRK